MLQRNELTLISLGAASLCVLVSGVFVLVPTSGCGKDMDAVSTQHGICDPSIATIEYCKSKFCGKDGSVISVPDDTNVPAPQNAACGKVTCTDGEPKESLVREGTSCNGQAGVCDAQGVCVACIEGTNLGCLAEGTCVQETCTYCTNGKLEPNETDIDCGGLCDPCAQGKACSSTNDCVGGLTCVDGVCCASSECAGECQGCNVPGKKGECNDIPKYGEDPSFGNNQTCLNGDGKACNGGGDCRKAVGQSCNGPTDCASGTCVGPGGSKVCLKPTGDPCVNAGECASGACTTEVCK